MHVYGVVFECVVEALCGDWAGGAEFSCFEDVGDVFVVLGEHEVGFAFAVGVLLPSVCCLYIVFGWVVWLVHFVVVFLFCWMCVWYGCPVLGSYLAAVAMAFKAFLRACIGFLGCGRTESAPSAYGAPVPMAYMLFWSVNHA